MSMQPFSRHEMGTSVGDFFDKVSEQYDQSIRRIIPPYQEMFETLLGYCFLDPAKPLSILELGCGTGNLSVYLRDVFPQAHLTLVDLSHDMLQQASQKLGGGSDSLRLVEGGFMAIEFQEAEFDMVVSSMALHHLLDEEKPAMYARIYRWLKPNGVFRCADETKALPEAAHMLNMQRWEAWVRENGITQDEIDFWSEHAEQYDHYAPLADHFRWLEASGFTAVDCQWRKLMWTVFGGVKGA